MSKKSRYELDPERLASTDEYGNRVYIHPEDVKGKWKTRRTLLYWVLIFLYLILPWIYIDGKPSILIDLTKREFTFMGFTLFGMEPLLFFLLLITGLFFIAFLVSKLGRVWCGWGCPQTVFIQEIFLKVEALIEGHAFERMKLDQAPWSFKKIFKRSLKWLLFILISSHIAHTFIGYFVGPRELFNMTMQSPSENMSAFIAINIITLILLLDFGWFREQFCIIACPYGRIQSVLMDEQSLVVAYDEKRGEPRRGTDNIDASGEGDCVNCYSCVKVCPTGIDIRRGVQLECIACTQCIDACDSIMDRLKKPRGLIRYSTEVEMNSGKKTRSYRSYLYVVGSIFFFLMFIYFFNSSMVPELIFVRGIGQPYLQSETSEAANITNRFTLKIKHQGKSEFDIKLNIEDPILAKSILVQVSEDPIKLIQAEKKVFIFFKFPKSILVKGSKIINITVTNLSTHSIVTTKEVTLVGPLD